MYNFFKAMEEVAGDSSDLHSKDITVELATKAGYEIAPYTFANGNVRDRVRYTGKFDDVLVAKWFTYYKKMFTTHLYKYANYGNYVIDIINDTFYAVMYSIHLEDIVNDKVIDKYANLALISKTKAFLCRYCQVDPSNPKYNPKMDNQKFRANSSNYNISIDELMNDKHRYTTDDNTQTLVEFNFAQRYKPDSMEMRLLSTMMETGEKFQSNSVDTYLGLSREECTENNKRVIADAYNSLTRRVSAMYKKPKCSKVFPSSIHYSFEV